MRASILTRWGCTLLGRRLWCMRLACKFYRRHCVSRVAGRVGQAVYCVGVKPPVEQIHDGHRFA